MDDRKLLEAAAKAVNGGAWHPLTHNPPNGEWNPLTDDGDALRLAVRCDIDVTHNNSTARAEYMIGIGFFTEEEPYDSDPCAATRRAIVRAAAAIGSQA